MAAMENVIRSVGFRLFSFNSFKYKNTTEEKKNANNYFYSAFIKPRDAWERIKKKDIGKIEAFI